jgi:hypothetical protein
MEQSYKTEFGRRFDIFQQSAEMEIYQNLKALRASFRVFYINFHELIQWLEHLKDPRESLIRYAPDKRHNLDALIDETSRLLHNLLASAQSLVDHTRVIKNRLYSDRDFGNEYEIKLNQELKYHPVRMFVQKLRNYTLHYTLPILALQITCSEDLNFSMRIDVETLKKWDDWGSSKTYLDTLGDSCCIVALVNEYFALIQNFYDWLTKRQQELHQTDFENLHKMHEELMTEKYDRPL